jgi:hypothetical protein
MRYGGLIENSLIIEGYWYSSTHSTITPRRGPKNAWLAEGKQRGRSAVVRNNVQFVYAYPNPNDPDTDKVSQGHAQPGNGYMLSGGSFGAVVERNIVSGAMLVDDLGFRFGRLGRPALRLGPNPTGYQDGNKYTMQRNTLRHNIAYRTGEGLGIGGDWTGAGENVVEDNVLAVGEAIDLGRKTQPPNATQLKLRQNRFYTLEDESLPEGDWVGPGNTVAPYADAAAKEGWPDPDRTLKRYVTEELGLTLLDWSDDPWLPESEVDKRVEAGEPYDPMGLKTFMAVAINMRRGGAEPIPASGKPSWTADYPWDSRFTGQAVVNWVRAGFGMEPVGDAAGASVPAD